jgi:ElaA protein
MQTAFICKHFNELTTKELYSILKLRIEVFTIEQQCAYQDCDDRDLICYHLMGIQNNELVAYSRLLPKGVSYDDYCAIGRVLTKSTVRGQQIGITLMKTSISLCKELFNEKIKIGAQSYLEKFYSDLGFVATGHQYLEDEIPHMSMVLDK